MIRVEGLGVRLYNLKGLSAGDEIVISAQFMLDSESRLREAVQKMLEGRRPGDPAAAADDELDMEGLQMDDRELDMSGLSMEDAAEADPPEPSPGITNTPNPAPGPERRVAP
jgi:hypothetical protein